MQGHEPIAQSSNAAPMPAASAEKSGGKAWKLGCVAFLLLGLVSCCCGIGYLLYDVQHLTDTFAPLAGACEGNAVDGAGSYGANARVVVMKPNRQGEWAYAVDFNQNPHVAETLAATNAVVCVEEEVEVFEEIPCSFLTFDGQRTFRRSHYQARAYIVDPSTGAVVYDGVMQSDPPGCGTDGFVPDDEDHYRGESIDLAVARAWLDAHL